jgi:hypothetical protein
VTNDPNPPQGTAITPALPTPSTPGAPPNWKPPGMRQRLMPIVFVLFALLVWNVFHPKPNVNEQVATKITDAVIANDMKPVETDFNAITREKVEDRGRVGALSQQLNDLGKLESIKEDTPKDAQPRYHHFIVKFDKATWVEDMTYDSDGKIESFHVHPPSPSGQ